MTAQWFVLPVNPYPWKVPPFSPGRKAGRLYVVAGRDEGLHTYKQAIKAEMMRFDAKLIEGDVDLRLWFWRNIPEYTTHQGRTARKHEADTTNLQKATEDALQGILFNNDKDNVFIQSWRVAQGPDVPSCLVIMAQPMTLDPTPFPPDVQFQIDEAKNGAYYKPDNKSRRPSFGDAIGDAPF